MLLLEQNTIKKRQIDENATKLDISKNNSGEYKIKVISNNAVYIRESKSSHLLELYYLVF